MSRSTLPRTARATEEAARIAAYRAAADPAKLAKAVRVVRAALDRQRLTLADLTDASAGGASGAS